MAGFYDYSVKDSKGNEVPMSSYQGKVVLVRLRIHTTLRSYGRNV